MAERVRLLGGVFDIDSAPGAGTTISVSLPRWSATPVPPR
jgi:signal transduction histidine kinase